MPWLHRATQVKQYFRMIGLFLAATGAFSWYYAPDARVLAGAGLLAGGGLVLGTAWRQASRGTARRLFVPRATRGDVAIGVASVCCAITFIAMRLLDTGDVSYLPFPELHAPSYSLAAAAASLLLLAPLATGARR